MKKRKERKINPKRTFASFDINLSAFPSAFSEFSAQSDVDFFSPSLYVCSVVSVSRVHDTHDITKHFLSEKQQVSHSKSRLYRNKTTLFFRDNTIRLIKNRF